MINSIKKNERMFMSTIRFINDSKRLVYQGKCREGCNANFP